MRGRAFGGHPAGAHDARRRGRAGGPGRAPRSARGRLLRRGRHLEHRAPPGRDRRGGADSAGTVDTKAGVRKAFASGRRSTFRSSPSRYSADLEDDGTVRAIDGVVSGLGSRPRVLSGWGDAATGARLDDALVEELAARAHKQCHPLENIIVDPEWRRAMVPVYVTRALDRDPGRVNGAAS
ncbi:MAG: hypothetical protein U5R14_14820 [Gemmatimonadota bacterium]|nr:hypothetical protein [Gemmatimonadota bacterium]